MAESAERRAPVNDPDAAESAGSRRAGEEDRAGRPGPSGPADPPSTPPPTWIPPDPADAMARYRRAAPWIIGVFGLMGAVVLLAVPVSILSDVEPTSRRTVVLASILAFFGVAVAIISSAVALGPRSAFIEAVRPRRSRILRHFSARRMVEDAFARQPDPEAANLVSDEMKHRLVRFEQERNAVRIGFAGVMAGAIAIGTAAGIMIWEFEDPTTVFEIDRIHADTVRLQADAERLQAETGRIDAEIDHLETATELDRGELAVQADKLQLELELLEESIAKTRADTTLLEAEADAAPTIETLVSQIADLEISVEDILDEIIDLQGDVARGRSISG